MSDPKESDLQESEDLTDHAYFSDEDLPSEDTENSGEDLHGDIELAYRQALEALDEAERQVGSALVDFAEDHSVSFEDEKAGAALSVGQQLADELAEAADTVNDQTENVLVEGLRRVTPRQVIEAALFVGGEVSLNARRLASLIGQDVDTRVAVSLIDSLNQSYARQNRPYEIRLHEGGYQLELREQYQEISLRAFGIGPREIKLSPETLEVLAYVAYNQPLTKEEMTQIDRPNSMSILRQLLRLQLVELQRTGSKRTDVSYVTSSRFLQLFGLRSLADLPTADIFRFK